jgi:hypothetical protein
VNCPGSRSARHGLGWIEPELLQKAMDITFANVELEVASVAADAFNNQFRSRIKA